MIEIEFSDPVEPGICSCCGGTTYRFTRFVYKDGSAHAVYYASFQSNHPERGVKSIVSLGEWGVDGIPDERVAFGLVLKNMDDNYGVIVIDAATTPWSDADILGKKLSREEALAHEWVDDVFHITNHIFDEDHEVTDLLDQVPPVDTE